MDINGFLVELLREISHPHKSISEKNISEIIKEFQTIYSRR